MFFDVLDVPFVPPVPKNETVGMNETVEVVFEEPQIVIEVPRVEVDFDFTIDYARANITRISSSGLVTITTNKPVVVRYDWEDEKLPVEIFDVWFVKFSEEENEMIDFNLVSFTDTEI